MKPIRLTESDLHRIIRESVKRMIKESNEYVSSETGEVIDDNTPIYYTIRDESGYEDDFPMTPSNWEFSYDVVRMFTASENYANWYNNYYTEPIKTCTLKELLDICPLPSEQVYDILFNKSGKLFNVYEEIKRNEKTGNERWEIEDGYQNYKTVSDTPAQDSGWYEPYTYEKTNFLNRL